MASVNPINQVLKIQRIFSAPRDEVFKAWTNPELLKKWWGPKGFTTPTAEIDLRVGGKYRLEMLAPDGSRSFLSGVYKEVTPPARLVYSWGWEEGSACGEGKEAITGETLITVEFIEMGSKTEVLLFHEGLPTDEAIADHNDGWSGSFDCLDELFEAS